MGIKIGQKLRAMQDIQPAQPAQPVSNRKVGTTSLNKRVGYEDSQLSVSMTSGAANGSTQVGSVPLDIDLSPMMDGMDYDADDKQLFNVYRDIYFFDPICGSTVDLFSTLPFSDISFSGAKDSVLEPYYEAHERLGLTEAFPGMSTDIKVTGAYVGSLLHDKKDKAFFDIMTHRYDNIDVTPLPFFNQDPILEWQIPQDIKRAFTKDSKRIDKLKKFLGESFIERLVSDVSMELDPIGTLYIPRKTFSFGEGISFFRRVLPIWLIEKNLYRGTLIESGRRQRGILHAQMGDGGDWEPSVEEMEFMTDLLLSADSDPIGSIICTRLGVNISEFRQGGDFWKITDIWDQTSQFKMRAMGISESFLSGDATFDNQQAGINIAVEYMKAFRDHLTRQVYYKKIFPLVSMMNGNAVNRSGKIIRKNGMLDGDQMDVMKRMQDGSRLFLPNVHWSKQLRPDIDNSMMENLRAMTELGVPVPLRTIAAAGGFNFDQMLMDQDEDLALRRKLGQYRKRQQEVEKEYALNDDEADSFSSASSVLGGRARPGLKRDYGDASEIAQYSPTGKKKLVIDQRSANNKANNAIYRAVKNYQSNATEPLDTGKVDFNPSKRDRRGFGRF